MGIELGQVVDGKYRVTARIGVGGMGAVYAGEHLKLHRKVAIKVLHAAVASDPEVVTRFEREAQAAGRIGNDHILEVFDLGEFPGGDRYMVMEFLDGEPMNARFARLGRVSPQQLYPLVRQMLEGLAAAHAAGIVHRDLKPANVFILREKAGLRDYVKIIDFGISKFQSVVGDAQHHQTRTGTIIGTPSYMSPEQARGLREADARSDIYAVGVILYEAVTGRCPFEGASINDLLFKIFLHEPPAIESLAQGVDPAFGTLIMKALSKEPDDRFASAGEFIAALDAWMRTGAGVAVARPPAVPATVIEGPRGPPRPDTPRPSAPRTQGSWAESYPGTAGAPTKRSTTAVAIVLGVVVTVLGIGGVVVLATRGAGHRGNVAAAAASEAIPTPTSTVIALPEPAADVPPVPAAASATTNVLAPSVSPPAPSALPSPTASAPLPAHSRPRTPKPPPPRPPLNPFEDR